MKRSVVWLLILCAGGSLVAQESGREIWDSAFRQKRPARSPGQDQRTPAPPVDYRVGSGPTPTKSANNRVIGLTVWRLRRPERAETAPRLLVQEAASAQAAEYVAERVSPGQGLSVGDRIRIGIEVAERGFLYVIDREGYADGTTGPPHLIYPARNLNRGDNRVEPGRLVEIPGQGDSVPALRVTRQSPQHVREDLTILVTNEPLPGIAPADRETQLPDDLVATWERKWGSGAAAPRLDLAAASPVALWTSPERDAGLAQRLLTQDDPMPASLYQATLKGDGVMVRIPLPIN